MLSVTLTGLDELARKANSLADYSFLKAGVQAAAVQLQGALKTYPAARRLTRASVYGMNTLSAVSKTGKPYTIRSPFKSVKQHRYFFWALSRGLIQVPYVRGSSPRSERLQAKWTITTGDNGFSAVVGNNVSYGPLVMGADQTLFMKAIGWQRVEDIAAKEGPAINKALMASVKAYLNQ